MGCRLHRCEPGPMARSFHSLRRGPGGTICSAKGQFALNAFDTTPIGQRHMFWYRQSFLQILLSTVSIGWRRLSSSFRHSQHMANIQFACVSKMACGFGGERPRFSKLISSVFIDKPPNQNPQIGFNVHPWNILPSN